MSVETEVARYEALRYLRTQSLGLFHFRTPYSKKEEFVTSWIMNEQNFGQTYTPLIPRGTFYDEALSQLQREYTVHNIELNKKVINSMKELYHNISIPKVNEIKIKMDEEEGVACWSFTYNRKGSFTMQIPTQLFDKLLVKYKAEREYLVMCFIRYCSLGNLIDQLSLSLKIVDEIERSLPLNKHLEGEIFSSFWNRCTSGVYYSMFPDIERELGSLGSYFENKIESGIYIAHPQYDEYFIKQFSLKAVEEMKNTRQLTYIIFFPLWENSINICYTQFEGYNILEQSGYIKSEIVVKNSDHIFYNNIYEDRCGKGKVRIIILSNDQDIGDGKYILDSIRRDVGQQV
jgi:hypothetical protein